MRHTPIFYALAMIGAAAPAALAAPVIASPSPPTSPNNNAAQSCAALAGQTIGIGHITAATWVSRGDDLTSSGAMAALKSTSDFCRVWAELKPAPTSQIKIQLWLPSQWNGKFLGTGGGGFSGGYDSAPLSLRPPVAQGYAALVTDAGHATSDDARWAYQQPQRVIDWAHRANHVSAIFAKAVIQHHYGQSAQRSYFQGCSNGGRDALMEARRYPNDYDAIIAGAPAPDWNGMNAAFLWNWQAIFQTAGAAGLVQKIGLVSRAIRAKCDALDGVKDGVLENPQACHFDPAELACSGSETNACLTTPEIGALRKIYAGPYLANTRYVYSGLALGDEDIPANASSWLDPSAAGTAAFATEYFRWMVHQDPQWTADQFRLDRDYRLAVKRMGPLVDAHDPDLRPFFRRGGKLLLWHGWSDARVPALRTVRYYNDVRKRVGANMADQHMRLFMVPGMGHCFAGPGPNKFDALSALDQWAESGTAPQKLLATKYENDLFAIIDLPTKAVRTRPLCPFPKTAQYQGGGSTDDAANFICR